jgi:phage shock protein PspC (stress-responsive transcriptional regulator)
MKRRDYHFHHHHHHEHSDARPTLRTNKQGGFFKRTIKGLATKFNVSKRTIIIGFIILFVFTKFFALLAFFLAYHWIKNPGKYEDIFDRTVEKSRYTFDNMRHNSAFQQAGTDAPHTAHHTTGNSTPPPEDDGFDFADLKRKFDDLEKRAGGMEEHVSSEEYRLRKEFEGI